MKLATAEVVAESSFDDSAAATMGIENNAHMFSILSDKLYTNKPKAIVREICCNALDAGGKPFLISIGEELSIRDFGPGMSHAFMMGGYTRIGHSTKTGSDDQIGGFGIGRMSIFSYADEYIVRSVTDLARTYLIYKAGNGLPAVQLIAAEESEEPTGVEVKVPIRSGDFNNFKYAAQETLCWFPPGSFQTFGFTVPARTASMVGEGFEVHPDLGHTHILVGPVAYRHDFNLPSCITLRFEVGEVQPAPNRESLSLDAVTQQKIADRIAYVQTALPELVIEKAGAMHPVDRLRLIHSLAQDWKLRDLFSRYLRDHTEDRRQYGTILPRPLERVMVDAPVAFYDRGRGGSHSKPVFHDPKEIHDPRTIDNHRWIFNDVTDKYPKVMDRLRHAHVFGYVVHPSEVIPDAAALRQILKRDIELLSTYPAPPAARRTRTAYEAPSYLHGSLQYRQTPADVQIYIEHDAGWDLTRLLGLEMVKGRRVWVLTKEGRRRFPNAVRLDAWVKAHLPPPEPQVLAARQAYRAIQSHALVHHILTHTKLPASLQRLKSEIQGVKQLSDRVSDYATLVSYELVPRPKVTDRWRLEQKVQRAVERNRIAMALLTRHWDASLIEEVLR